MHTKCVFTSAYVYARTLRKFESRLLGNTAKVYAVALLLVYQTNSSYICNEYFSTFFYTYAENVISNVMV